MASSSVRPSDSAILAPRATAIHFSPFRRGGNVVIRLCSDGGKFERLFRGGNIWMAFIVLGSKLKGSARAGGEVTRFGLAAEQGIANRGP